MTDNAPFTIKTMSREELNFAIDLAYAEGWNPGLDDASSFYTADPEGFLVGCLGDRPVGCISAVSYGRSFGFLGLYIVVPEYRGKGYGKELWNTAVERLKGRCIGLDGVVEQQENYKKRGFLFAYRNIRFEYRPGKKRENGNSPAAIPLTSAYLDVLSEYEKDCFPANRHGFLKSWLDMPHAKPIGCFLGNVLQGYGVIRKCREGYKIGPLFADNADIAETIFTELCSDVKPGQPVFFDVPEVNRKAMEMVESRNMTKV
ncbi:MAG: GNAT family N-acetyltransferase, partial [Gammaproteobacteria bacterium]